MLPQKELTLFISNPLFSLHSLIKPLLRVLTVVFPCHLSLSFQIFHSVQPLSFYLPCGCFPTLLTLRVAPIKSGEASNCAIFTQFCHRHVFSHVFRYFSAKC